MTAPTAAEIEKFREYCVQQPVNLLDPATKIRAVWPYGSFKHKIKRGEDLGRIANRYASSGKAPKGCDWKFLARFNFGCDKASYVNWVLIDKFGFDETKNLTRNKKNYAFKGEEEILIPCGPANASVGAVSPSNLNTLVTSNIKPLTVRGPSLMTPGIESEFTVLSYNKPPRTTRNSINWKILDVAANTSTIHSTQGEKVAIQFAPADVGKVFRVYPYIGADSTIIEGVFVELQVLELLISKQVALSRVKDNLVLHTDNINKVYNPSAIVIGANRMNTAAIFKVTSVKPTSQAVRAKTPVLPRSVPMSPWDNLPVNYSGLTWRIKAGTDLTAGKAKFIKQGKDQENIGSECYLEGKTVGLLVLEAYCRYAKKPFRTLTLKVVNERSIKYRVNLLKHSDAIKTTFTVARIQEFFDCADRYLRQIGLKMEADNTATTYPSIGADNFVVAGAGQTGYFNVTGVPRKYVDVEDADSELASVINCEPKVLNFAFAYRDKTEADKHPKGYGFGIGPSAAKNLLSKPQGGTDALAAIPDTFNGVYEDIEPNATGTGYKDIEAWTTPDTPSAEADKIGIIIHNPQPVIEGGKDPTTDAYLSEMGQTIAHEIAHCAALKHRDGDDGVVMPADPGTPHTGDEAGVNGDMTERNLMYSSDHDEGPSDLDLLQLNVYRSSVLALNNSNRGGLTLKAFTGRSNKISSKANQTKYVNVEVSRRRVRVPNAYMNFWVKATANNIVKIQTIDNWQVATRMMDTGMVKLKLKFGPDVGKTAKIIVYAGHEDDLVETEIDCEIIA